MSEDFLLQLAIMPAQRLSDENWYVLRRPVDAMGEHAWVGGRASDAFGHETVRSQAEIRAALWDALDLLHEKKARPPMAR